MKDFLQKYGKQIFYGVIALIALFILFEGAKFIYKNTYAHEKYQYSSKAFQNQFFDENVTILKNIKRNGAAGEISVTFNKKELAEEYQIPIDKDLTFSNVEVSVIGKISSGEMNIRLVGENNQDVFNKVIKGLNIKEISRIDSYSKSYKFIISPNAAQNGDLEIKFRLN